MSVRDIIEGATQGRWWTVGLNGNGCVMHHRSVSGAIYTDNIARCGSERDGKFIATFDPEHVALLETVYEWAQDGTDEAMGGIGLADAVRNLAAYRTEHSL